MRYYLRLTLVGLQVSTADGDLQPAAQHCLWRHQMDDQPSFDSAWTIDEEYEVAQSEGSGSQAEKPWPQVLRLSLWIVAMKQNEISVKFTVKPRHGRSASAGRTSVQSCRQGSYQQGRHFTSERFMNLHEFLLSDVSKGSLALNSNTLCTYST